MADRNPRTRFKLCLSWIGTLQAGYDAHLAKPFDAGELAVIARRLIDEKAPER